jgi:hypothetical protein
MIRKSAKRFPSRKRVASARRSCSNNNLERDGDYPGAIALEAGFNSKVFRSLTSGVQSKQKARSATGLLCLFG